MKQRYGSQINIKTGMEFGMQMHTISQYEALFNKYPFDFIILSIHEIGDLEFWNQGYQKDKTQQEYNEGYYEAMHKLVSNYKTTVYWGIWI